MRVDNVKITMEIPVHLDNQIETDMFIQRRLGKKPLKMQLVFLLKSLMMMVHGQY